MRQKVHLNLYRLGAGLLLLGLVAACGQKGQLVRPGENSAGFEKSPPAALLQRGEVSAVAWYVGMHAYLRQPPEIDKDPRYASPT